MNESLVTESETHWQQVAPHLDAALGDLSEPDRDALLLRYFERKSAGEMGQVLGISHEAAQKRVNRAIDRLRVFLAKRGVAAGTGALAVILSANAVHAAPAGLGAKISAAALTGTATTTATLIATTKTIAMTTLQKIAVTAALTVTIGAGIYEAKQAHDAQNTVAMLQAQQAPMQEQIPQLQNSFAKATNRLTDLLAENAQLKSNPHEAELLKLRGQAAPGQIPFFVLPILS